VLISEHCAFTQPIHSFGIGDSNNNRVKNSERVIFVHFITFMMKTALYQKKFKKAQNQQKLLHTLQSKAESEYYGTNTNRGI